MPGLVPGIPLGDALLYLATGRDSARPAMTFADKPGHDRNCMSSEKQFVNAMSSSLSGRAGISPQRVMPGLVPGIPLGDALLYLATGRDSARPGMTRMAICGRAVVPRKLDIREVRRVSNFHRYHGRVLRIAQRERGLHVAYVRGGREFLDKGLKGF